MLIEINFDFNTMWLKDVVLSKCVEDTILNDKSSTGEMLEKILQTHLDDFVVWFQDIQICTTSGIFPSFKLCTVDSLRYLLKI